MKTIIYSLAQLGREGDIATHLHLSLQSLQAEQRQIIEFHLGRLRPGEPHPDDDDFVNEVFEIRRLLASTLTKDFPKAWATFNDGFHLSPRLKPRQEQYFVETHSVDLPPGPTPQAEWIAFCDRLPSPGVSIMVRTGPHSMRLGVLSKVTQDGDWVSLEARRNSTTARLSSQWKETEPETTCWAGTPVL